MEGLAGSMPIMDWQSNDLEGTWKAFKQHVDFMFSGPLKGKTEPEKCSYLMIWVGEKGRNIYTTWTLTEDESKLLETYYTKFQEYVKPRTNTIYNRYKFHCRVQKDGESFDQFVTELKIMVKDCNYGDNDEMVRDRIVIGVKNPKIREKLINVGNDLTLAKAMDVARTYELTSTQVKAMSGEDVKVNALKQSVNKSRRQFTNKQKPEVRKPVKTHTTSQHTTSQAGTYKQNKHFSEKLCGRCGYSDQHEVCPAKGKQCHKCGGFNHFEKKCRSKRKTVHLLDDSLSDDELFVGCLETNVEVNKVDLEWSETIKIHNTALNFQLDTGAMCNVLPMKTLRDMNKHHAIKSSSVPLRSYSGHKIETKGTVQLTCEYKGNTYDNVEFQVVDIPAKPVLGASTYKQMGLIQRVNQITETNKSLPSDIQKSYGDFLEGLGCMPGEHSIKIDKSIEPVVHAPRKIPISIRDRVKAELDRMEKTGVIIKQQEPTQWVNSMVTVLKPNGKLRICIDPRDLNRAICREHYPMKSIEDVVLQIPDAKVFSKLDATSGFWQIRLDDESAKLCTFNTPYGRYSFTRLPFGIKSAPEVYQRSISDMVQGLAGCEAIVDDILVWGRDMEDHDKNLSSVLDRIRENNLKLSKGKCYFRKDRVTYVGHELSANGVRPDTEKVRAVEEMEPPTNTQELMTFMGFIQYLGKFLPNLSEVSAPLRQLLEKQTLWHWEREQEQSFQKLKQMVTNAPVLSYYDPKKPLTLTVDASSKGLGAALVQKEQPIAYASRALTKTQQNYAQIEKETLAIVFGCTKFHQYVFGRKVTVESDHKPLQSICRKPLLQAPPRLQKLLLTLQKYDLDVVFKPGKTMFLADTLSRAFLKETNEDLVPDLTVNEVHLLQYLPVSPEKYQKFQQTTAEDEELKVLQDIVLKGWPDTKEQVPVAARHYWSCRDEISSVDGLLFKNHKLVVPKSMRKEMLKTIHNSHLGIVKCKSRAREVMYWPGMSTEVEETVAKCSTCAQHLARNPKEPLTETEIPDRPWSVVSADIFEFKGHNYLVTVDNFSKWPEVAKLDNLSSNNTIHYLKSQFSRNGLVDKLITDNGPQFSSDAFATFAKEYGFIHSTSSLHYAQSNGQAERIVQTVKNLIKKASDPYLALLAYRNTTMEEIGLSPAQMFYGRRLKTDLPTTYPLLKSQEVSNGQEIKKRLKLRQSKHKMFFDRHSGPELKPLNTGDKVIMNHNNSWIPATVSGKHKNPKSYILENSNGRKYRRNRKHIRPTKADIQIRTEEPSVEPPPLTTFDTPEKATTETVLVDKPNSVRPSSEQLISPKPNFEPSLQKCTRSGRVVVPPRKLCDYVS